jgi:L-ascorbate metabolism protein UlaG (beta-lactamase superfamily)
MSLDNTSPKKGEIAFIWFNAYAGVAIKTPSKTLLVDPAEIDPKMFKSADMILITHEHSDHLDEYVIKDIYKRTNCHVIADSTSYRRLKGIIASDKLLEAQVGSTHKIGNITVKAEVCKHPAASPVTYLITTEDGLKIFHSADSVPHPDMKQIGDTNPPDIAFVTVGAPAPGASPKTGLEIVKMVKPKTAVPYHAPKTELKAFTELLAKEMPKVKGMLIEMGKHYKYP